MLKLSKRLLKLIEYVPHGSIVADIGTDHAMLPCYLLKENISPFAIAADVSKGPLHAAEVQIKSLLLENNISLRLGDGLKVLAPGEVETVVIAGMGGSTIKKILEVRPQVVAKLERLILQPNTAAERVRSWAVDNNWKIIDEEILNEDNRFYEIIILEQGSMFLEDEILKFIGPCLLEKKHLLLIPYLQSQKKGEEEILRQLANSNSKEAIIKADAIRQKWEKVRQVVKCRLNVEI